MNPSIAVVVLDTLRKDAFDEHFDWLNGLQFSNAFSPSHWTTPVHAAMFVGAYPTEVGVHAKQLILNTSKDTIAEKLRQAGWTCRGYSANGNVSQSFKFDRGFNEFTAKGYHSDGDIFDWQSFIAETDDGVRRYPRALIECIKDDSDTIPSLYRGIQRKYHDIKFGGSPNLTIEAALEYLNECTFEGQEFLFLNLMEAHPKYTPPEKYQSVEPFSLNSVEALEALLSKDNNKVDTARMRQTYDDSIRYLSDQYKRVHSHLMENFEYIITVSDHGETFGEHGIYGHIPALVPEIVHIPLIISGNVLNKTVSAPVSIIDIHQTIASITDVERAPRGQNLIETTSEKRPCITESHGLSEWQRMSLKTNHSRRAKSIKSIVYVGESPLATITGTRRSRVIGSMSVE